MDGRRSLESYERRLNAVLDYIEAFFDQPLPLEHLSDVARFSPFHFHRLFKASMGETPSVFALVLFFEMGLGMVTS